MDEREFKNFADNIKFDDAPDNAHRDRLEQKLLKALDTTPRQQQLWRTVTTTRIVKLAIAAGVIVTICLFFAHYGSDEQTERPQIAKTISSPAELMTLASINNAFRMGGLEAVDKQFARVFKMLRPQPQNPTMQDLYADLNN